jgi:nucleotide-binding universal stress UspA family protein
MVLHRDPAAAEPFAPIRRLVVPLDGSARAAQALPFTLRLARRLQLPVQLVMVIDPTRILPPAYAYDPEAMDDALTDLRETAHWALKQAESLMEREGTTVESVLLYGPVMTCIQSALNDGDIVLMTTHGVGRGSAGRMGSVAERMLQTVTTPLVIMRGMAPGEVVVEGYVACPWVEPLSARGGVAAQAQA